MDATADYGTGITASIVSVATVKGTGDGPGDRSGPALLVTARLTNVANGPTDLDATVVDLYGPDGAPAHVLEYDPRAKPFSGVLEEKASATATYVIDRPRAAGDITLTISYDGQTPAVAFTGAIPS